MVFRFVRVPTAALLTAATLALALLVRAGREPGRIIELEDEHVEHTGGELTPPFYTPMRHIYRGGWLLHEGESVTFLARKGQYKLWYSAATRLMVELDHHAYSLPPTAAAHKGEAVEVTQTGRVTLRCVSGTINVDRMVHAR